jgi:hypothetical protein
MKLLTVTGANGKAPAPEAAGASTIFTGSGCRGPGRCSPSSAHSLPPGASSRTDQCAVIEGGAFGAGRRDALLHPRRVWAGEWKLRPGVGSAGGTSSIGSSSRRGSCASTDFLGLAIVGSCVAAVCRLGGDQLRVSHSSHQSAGSWLHSSRALLSSSWRRSVRDSGGSRWSSSSATT